MIVVSHLFLFLGNKFPDSSILFAKIQIHISFCKK